MAEVTRAQASRHMTNGEPVYAVPEAGTFRLFTDSDEAWAWADERGVKVLDWETGEYAE